MIETCGTLDNVQLTLFGNYESEEGDCYQDSCCADDITECCVNKPGPALAPVETPRGESIVTAPTLAPAPKTPTAKAKAKTSPPPALLISSAKVNGGGANAIYYWLVGIALFVIAY